MYDDYIVFILGKERLSKMPKNETVKNTKGKSTNKSTVSKKNSTTKKTISKKVETKATNKVIEAKKKPSKVASKEEIRPIVQEKITERKETNRVETDTLMNNTPFVICVCIIIVLIAILIFTLFTKRIPKTSKGKEIVTTLNGKTITADELYENLKESYGTNSLVNLVDTYIANKEITIKDEDKEYAKEVVKYYKEYAEYYNVDLMTFVSNYLGLSGINNEDEFYDFVLEDYKKNLAIKKFVGDNASEDDLKKHYEENFSDKLTARHILIEVDKESENSDDADKEAYDKAVKLINELNDTKKEELESKFEELAKNNSDDTGTYSNGGLIEDFTKNGYDESFFNATNDLKDGEYTKEPVKSTYGYHIILRISSKPVEKYDDIKEDVKNSYAETLLSSDSKLQSIKWDELRKQYKMSIKDDIIKSTYNKTIDDVKNQKTEN